MLRGRQAGPGNDLGTANLQAGSCGWGCPRGQAPCNSSLALSLVDTWVRDNPPVTQGGRGAALAACPWQHLSFPRNDLTPTWPCPLTHPPSG